VHFAHIGGGVKHQVPAAGHVLYATVSHSMAAKKSVQNTHLSKQIRALHASLVDIVSVINQPQRDEVLIREAGIALDRALFPLLVGIGRFGPIGVVDLADRAGRDYTTVSRQVAKLAELGLVDRREGASDRRRTETAVSPKGRAMIDRIDAARERMARRVFASWDPGEIDELVRLTRKLADAMQH
jgi:DNA-binding MarR family transcriptional regulator